MIAITRPPAPDFLIEKNGIWDVETQNAITYYSGSSVTESFKFTKYNDSRVKNELKKVFLKCAYCESVYGHVYDGDIEHFRPKLQIDAVKGKPLKPGYYWLANDWDNLLLSCQHCNQRRKHLIYGIDARVLKSYGKLDQFPLADDTKRVRKHDLSLDEEEKVRLLLNPCKDKPEAHFEYDKIEGVIRPLTRMGEETIKVCVLQRFNLVQERKKHLEIVFMQMEIVKRELIRFEKEKSDEQKQILQGCLDYLMKFTKPESAYAGMSRFFIKAFLKENNLL